MSYSGIGRINIIKISILAKVFYISHMKKMLKFFSYQGKENKNRNMAPLKPVRIAIIQEK